MINNIKNRNIFNFEMNEESMLRFDSYDQDINKYKENLKIKHKKYAWTIVGIVAAMIVCSQLNKSPQLFGSIVVVLLLFLFVYKSLIYFGQELAIWSPRLLPYCYPIPVIFILWLFRRVLSNASLSNIIVIGILGLLFIVFLGIKLIGLIPT